LSINSYPDGDASTHLATHISTIIQSYSKAHN
jgi:hypothetical protein